MNRCLYIEALPLLDLATGIRVECRYATVDIIAKYENGHYDSKHWAPPFGFFCCVNIRISPQKIVKLSIDLAVESNRLHSKTPSVTKKNCFLKRCSKIFFTL